MTQTPQEIHTSVLLHESKEGLDIQNATRYIDATLGMGGHTHAFLSANPELKARGFDQDEQAREKANTRLKEFIDSGRCTIIPENFEKIGICAEFSPDAILFDIGVSSLQFDTPDRGFSFRFDAPLDMRMNQDDELTAEIIVNTWSAEDLEKIFLEYGEESWGRHIAKKIVEDRAEKPFNTTLQLSDFVARVKPFNKERKKTGKNLGGHPAVLVFQALRVAVNREFEVLETALHSAIKILTKGGRIGVISFHSLEDKIVKNIFASYEQKGKKQKYPRTPPAPSGRVAGAGAEGDITNTVLEKITKKPISPSPEEIERNPRSRSAKLRIMKKL